MSEKFQLETKKISYGTKGLQDTYLAELKAQGSEIVIFLINGTKLIGIMQDFDQFVILLKSPEMELIYKHAISTISVKK